MGATALEMSTDTIYNRIADWEKTVRESFVNYFGSVIDESMLMTWSMKKGYIDSDKFNKWNTAYKSNRFEAQDLNYYLYDDKGGSVEFAIVITENSCAKGRNEAYTILSEFMSENDIYHDKLNEFLSDVDF